MKSPKEIWYGFRQLLAPPTPRVGPTQSMISMQEPEPEPEPEPGPGPEKSQRKIPCSSAPLENLPAEIRRYLLFTLDYEELKTLINASPIYHQQYLLDRQCLRRSCLERTLGYFSADACAVYESGMDDFLKARTPKSVAHLIDSYEENLSLSHYSFLSELTMDEVMSMFSFHVSIVIPLAKSYTTWALNNLAKVTGKDPPQSHDELLSRTEEIRLVRALYRLELYCNLFGASHNRRHSRHTVWEYGDEKDLFERLLHMYEPWEVEEMACAFTFSQQKYDQIFKDIHHDVHGSNPYYGGRYPPTPPGAFDFDSEFSREFFLGGTISRGIKLLHHVLLEVQDHAQLVSVMRDSIESSPGCFLDDGLDEATQHVRSQQLQDLGAGWRGPPPFQGDSENDPPLAWELTWRHFFINWMLTETSLDIRRWGHIMWDAARLERTGGKEVLIRKHEERWKGQEWDASEWVW